MPCFFGGGCYTRKKIQFIHRVFSPARLAKNTCDFLENDLHNKLHVCSLILELCTFFREIVDFYLVLRKLDAKLYK